MSVTENLKPEDVFRYFEELSAIPRGSGNTDQVTEYLAAFAEEHNLDAEGDEYGNVIMRKEASAGYEKAAPVILQAHTDMVCAAAEGVTHDFENEGLKLRVEGDGLFAEGTTLGADDGIGVAYILAILADDTLKHPRLECIFTTDEETGMTGAMNLDYSVIEGKTLINLDSEDEGVLTVGCAGGIRVDTIFPVKRMTVKGTTALVKIDGLTGGHSGGAIHLGRANALKLIARFLMTLEREEDVFYSLVDLTGGSVTNAIPTSASAKIVIEPEDAAKLEDFGAEFEAMLKKEYAGIEDSLSVAVKIGALRKTDDAWDADTADAVVKFINLVPNGLLAVDGEGAPLSSSNVGKVRVSKEVFGVSCLTRSAVNSSRDAAAMQIKALGEALGGKTYLKEPYSAWERKNDSALADKMSAVYVTMFGKEPTVETVHGGLECGFFFENIEGLDAVSIGPDIADIHTPSEKLSISSAARTYDYLLKVLESLR